MKIRYINGKASSEVYSQNEHSIDIRSIDKDALFVVKKLQDNGYETYLVGGAIRDLLLGRSPKDFDVVTSATPREIHKLFYNSRIIGRRFKIVHVVFGQKIIEVSTFRSLKDHTQGNDNVFGTVEEDSQRRDYSINSLYYDPSNQTVLDFTHAMADFKSRKIRSLIPLNRTFKEDPVRLIRAVKYSVTTGFSMGFALRRAVVKYSSQLSRIGSSRMTEELNKILGSGKSSQIIERLNKYHLLVYILPCLSVYGSFPQIYQSLEELDNKINLDKKGVTKAQMYLALTEPLISDSDIARTPNEFHKDVVRQIKVFLTPNSPANTDIDESATLYQKHSKIFNAKFGNSKYKK